MNQPLTATPAQWEALRAFAQANPALFPSRVSPIEGASGTVCSADRVLLAGSQLASYILPDGLVPLERVFRRLPTEGVFIATPSKPCLFEIGSFTVPQQHAFVLLDFNFTIYRPSGVTPGDNVPLEDNRLSTQVGWDIQIDQRRQGNSTYELNPQLPGDGSTSGYAPLPNPGLIPGNYGPVFSPDSAFTAARFAQVQSSTGDALSLMPQRHHRQGLLKIPPSWVATSNQTLTLSCSVFRAVQIPLAFFEAEIFGILLPDANLDSLRRQVAPCIQKPGGV